MSNNVVYLQSNPAFQSAAKSRETSLEQGERGRFYKALRKRIEKIFERPWEYQNYKFDKKVESIRLAAIYAANDVCMKPIVGPEFIDEFTQVVRDAEVAAYSNRPLLDLLYDHLSKAIELAYLQRSEPQEAEPQEDWYTRWEPPSGEHGFVYSDTE